MLCDFSSAIDIQSKEGSRSLAFAASYIKEKFESEGKGRDQTEKTREDLPSKGVDKS